MAYTKQTWQCGDTITADRLNHMEDGIAECCSGGSEPLFLEVTEERQATASECEGIGGTVKVYNHTYQEVYDAIMAGQNIFMRINDGFGEFISLYYADMISGYEIRIKALTGDPFWLSANASNDYLKEYDCNAM